MPQKPPPQKSNEPSSSSHIMNALTKVAKKAQELNPLELHPLEIGDNIRAWEDLVQRLNPFAFVPVKPLSLLPLLFGNASAWEPSSCVTTPDADVYKLYCVKLYNGHSLQDDIVHQIFRTLRNFYRKLKRLC